MGLVCRASAETENRVRRSDLQEERELWRMTADFWNVVQADDTAMFPVLERGPSEGQPFSINHDTDKGVESFLKPI